MDFKLDDRHSKGTDELIEDMAFVDGVNRIEQELDECATLLSRIKTMRIRRKAEIATWLCDFAERLDRVKRIALSRVPVETSVRTDEEETR